MPAADRLGDEPRLPAEPWGDCDDRCERPPPPDGAGDRPLSDMLGGKPARVSFWINRGLRTDKIETVRALRGSSVQGRREQAE